MKQSHIVEKLRQILGNKNVSVNVASRGNKIGIPDVIVSRKGLASFIEIKIGADELSPLQRKFLESNYLNSILLHVDPSENIRDAHGYCVSRYNPKTESFDLDFYESKDIKFIVKHL